MNEYLRHLLSKVETVQTTADLLPFLAHRDGFVRQASISRAVALAHAGLLLPIAERLNDWVPQVRDAARAAVLTLIARVPASEAIGILHQVERLRTAGRSDHRHWLSDFECALQRAVNVDQLVACIGDGDVDIARACFNFLQRNAMVDASTLIRLGLGSRRDIVMSLRASTMINVLPLDAQDRHYRTALNSHFGAVRTVGIRALLCRPNCPILRELAISVLLDRQSSVRGAAMTYLRSEAVDVAAYYRSLLEAPTTTSAVVRICLGSLAGLRSGADLALVKSFLASPLISIRTSAYAAWLKLAESDKDHIAARSLADEARTIRKGALDMTKRQGAFIPFDTVCAVLTQHQEWRLLLRFSQLEKWNALEGIARVAIATGLWHPMRPELERELVRWMQTPGSFTRPNPCQLEFLRAAETVALLNAMTPQDVDFTAFLERELSIALGKRR
jgi:hypothetical protein